MRQRAKTSIKPPTPGREKVVVSTPGTPPRDRTKHLKKGIFFRYERARHGVVIGPVKMSGSSRSGKPSQGKTVPQILEEGGAIKTLYVMGIEGRPGRLGKRLRKAQVLARPYMRPAFEKELPGLSEMWRNSVRSGF